MRKLFQKLMRKILGIPNVDVKYVNVVAQSLSDAENLVEFMCRNNLLEGNPDGWVVWTHDGKSFVIEESIAENTESTNAFFDFDDDEIIII